MIAKFQEQLDEGTDYIEFEYLSGQLMVSTGDNEGTIYKDNYPDYIAKTILLSVKQTKELIKFLNNKFMEV